MDSRARRAREIQRQIGDVLLRNWDPLGVRDREEWRAEHADEYDAYVGPVYRLLVAGASAREIAEHLVQVETRVLGFEDTHWRMLVPVANKLRKLHVRLCTATDAG